MRKVYYLLTLSFFTIYLASCVKEATLDDEVQLMQEEANDLEQNHIDSAFNFASFTIDGIDYKWNQREPEVEFSLGAGGWDRTAPDTSYRTYLCIVSNDVPPLKLEIYRGWIPYLGDKPSDSAFRSFINTGSVPYSVDDLLAEDGVVVKWENNGVKYTSADSTEDYSDDSFMISEIEEDDTSGTDLRIKFTAEFNCRLYNEDGSASVLLSNGVFKGAFENVD